MESLKKAYELLREGQIATNEDLTEAVMDRVQVIKDMCSEIRKAVEVSKDDPGVEEAVDLATYLCSGISGVIDNAQREYALPAVASLGMAGKEGEEQEPIPGKTNQYGRALPDDLVALPVIENLSKEDIEIVAAADWYEPEDGHALLASVKEINFLSEIDPLDVGIDIKTDKLYLIEPVLHRYNEEDGFYHA